MTFGKTITPSRYKSKVCHRAPDNSIFRDLLEITGAFFKPKQFD